MTSVFVREFVVAIVLATVLAGTAACPPPFDALPFPSEGEGEGEGDGIPNITCDAPAVAPAACGGPLQTADWDRIDVDATVDSGVGAIVFDPSVSQLVIFTVDGKVWVTDGVDPLTTSQLSTCDGVQPRHAFATSDGTIVASGTGGTCVVLVANGTSEVLAAPGEATAVPLDGAGENVVVMHDEADTFTIETFSRAAGSATLAPLATLSTGAIPVPLFDASQTLGANVVNAAPIPTGGAFLVDELGVLYIVTFDGTTAALDEGGAGSFDANAPSGVVLATTSDDIALAVMDASGLTIGSLGIIDVVQNGVGPLVEIARDPALFPPSAVHETAIALAGDARVDVGDFGYVTESVTAGASPQQVGTCNRLQDVVDLAATQCGTMWGLTSSGAILAWTSDAARTGDAVATSVSASAASPSTGVDHIDILDATRALVSSDGGAVVATFDGNSNIDVDLAATALQAVGTAFDQSAEHAVVVQLDGSAKIFDPSSPRTSARDCTGGVGNDSDPAPEQFQLAVSNDPTAGAELRFFAAGFFGGAPGLVRCSVDTFTNALTCDANVTALPGLDTDLGGALLTFARVLVTSAGVVVVTNHGVVLSRGDGEAVLVDNSTVIGGAGAASDVFAAGRGRVVDAGDGCILVFGGANTPFLFDGGDDAPALVAATQNAHDPFPSVGARVEGGHIVASGGIGSTFYAIDYDVNATTCAQRFNDVDAATLGPVKARLRVTSAAFLGGRAYVGDELGDVYRLPAP